MQLIELLETDKQAYNQFVAAQPTGSFLQSWDWGQWQEKLGRRVFRFFIRDGADGSAIRSAQLVQMPLAFGKYYLYSPYGPVLAEGENFQFPTCPAGRRVSNFQTILNELNLKFPKVLFVRIEPKVFPQILNHQSEIFKSVNIQPGKTLIIDLKKTQDQLLAEMHSKTRYNIKVAQRHGVQIKDEFSISVGHGLYFKEAIELICATAKRQGFTAYPFGYYENLIDFFARNKDGQVKVHLYKAIFDNRLLASAIMIDFAKVRTFLFGGSAAEQKNVMAPYLLHFQAMSDAKAAGLEAYDFWGTETSRGEIPGFVRFKMGFGGEAKSYAGAYDLICQPWWYKGYKLVRRLRKIF